MKKSFLNEIATENSEREVSETFANFLYGFKKVKSITESLDDEALTKELALFIESNKSLRESIPSVKKNLYKHWKKGEYSTELAERAWDRLVTEGAKKYATEIGKEPRLWGQLFPTAILSTVTEGLERDFYNDLKKGKVNMEELFNE